MITRTMQVSEQSTSETTEQQEQQVVELQQPALPSNIEERLANIERQIMLINRNVFTVNELALWLDISPSRVYRLVREKNIPYWRQVGKIYFKKDEIEQWQLKTRISTNEEIESAAVTRCTLQRLKRI